MANGIVFHNVPTPVQQVCAELHPLKFFCGLVYQRSPLTKVTEEEYSGDLSGLYFKAIIKSITVNQGQYVKIFWLGRVHGILEGQA